MTKASVVIVNYNGEPYLDNLFTSLIKQSFKDFEIIIVDNASTDNSFSIIQKYADILDIKIIKNDENLGFCIANNRAIHLCKGDYVVFLNNDTCVHVDWLLRLVSKVENNSKLGAVVSSIFHPFSSEVNEGPMLYDVYGAVSGIAFSSFFYGTGASLLVRINLLREIGCFDEKLFMYQDDVDLCWRIRLRGYVIKYEPSSICYHLKNPCGVIDENLLMPLWKFFHAHCKNRFRILLKNYSIKNIIKRMPFTLVFVFARSMLLSFINRNPEYVSAFIKGLIWNLLYLNNTLIERHKTQCSRKVTDDELVKSMVSYSAELKSVSKLININKMN